jgi:hypothetical protein
VIICPDCEIALADDTRQCPMCQRDLHMSWRRTLVAGGLVVLFLLLGAMLWGSGRIKNRIQRAQFSNADVLKTAQNLVSINPAVHNPVGFSGADQTTVEHWDGRRWRVSGYVDTQPQAGAKVRTLYFAVLLYTGTNWNLEDLQLQSMESGSGAAHKN